MLIDQQKVFDIPLCTPNRNCKIVNHGLEKKMNIVERNNLNLINPRIHRHRRRRRRRSVRESGCQAWACASRRARAAAVGATLACRRHRLWPA